jgi:hypothetical protein
MHLRDAIELCDAVRPKLNDFATSWATSSDGVSDIRERERGDRRRGSSAGGKLGRGRVHSAVSIEQVERDAERHKLGARK